MFNVVYVLQMSNGQFYIGYTKDIVRRLKEHQSGKNHTTKKWLPAKLLYYEAFLSEVDARRREKYFKTTKGRTTLRLMLRDTLIIK